MIGTNNISLDVLKPNVIPMVYAKAGDSESRFITVTIKENGKKKSVSKSAIVYLDCRRPDGQQMSFLGIVNDDGTITVILPDWLLLVSGLAKCSISIVNGGIVLTTLSFQLTIEPYESVVNGIVVYTAYSALEAGTYYIVINYTPYQFTLTQPVPAGGTIRFNGQLTTASTYEDEEILNLIESGISVSNEATGTFLSSSAPDLIASLREQIAILHSQLNGKSSVYANVEEGDFPSLKTITINDISYSIPTAEFATERDIRNLWN